MNYKFLHVFSVLIMIQSTKSRTLIFCIKCLQVDMLVVGSRGMNAQKSSGPSAAGMGPVSKASMHRAPCPVIVVRMPTTTACWLVTKRGVAAVSDR